MDYTFVLADERWKCDSYLSAIEKMNRAFSDLCADYELSMDADKEKVSELKAMHVDVKKQLSDLVSYSSSSSGVISGLRGTGKTHLMLLARHEINENCFAGKANGIFFVYLNVKRLTMPEKFDQELFNRVFSVFLNKSLAHDFDVSKIDVSLMFNNNTNC